MKAELLDSFPVIHAGITNVYHPELNSFIEGRSSIKYLRFLRPVELDRLELPVHAYGRWTPAVPIHPSHITVSIFDKLRNTWKIVKDSDFPPVPGIWGKGLSQTDTDSQMEEHFLKIVKNTPPWILKLNGLVASEIKVECDREHPVWPNHGECNSSCFQVPFGLLNPLRIYGRPLKNISDPVYLPIIKKVFCNPTAPKGMKTVKKGESIYFISPKLSVGFALRRPVMMHLGWDALSDKVVASKNRLSMRRVRFLEPNRGVSGPLLVNLNADYGSHHWTGKTEVKGNVVKYKDLHVDSALSLDVEFEIFSDKIKLKLIQIAKKDIPFVEYEAWRFSFSAAKGMTGIAGIPTLKEGRSGDVKFPVNFAGDGVGCLSCRLIEGDPKLVSLQVESYRTSNEVTAGIVLGKRAISGECGVVPKGRLSAVFEFSVGNMEPEGMAAAGVGIKRHWSSNFSCYRPEWGGFSNHAVSVNCHVNQNGPIEVALLTKKEKNGPAPSEMAKFTVKRALMDGSGYGYWRNLYKDSDPVLVSSAGFIQKYSPDKVWLKSTSPGISSALKRILATIGIEGLSICRDLSGNSGSHRWSSNAWDVVGFGHMDAYVNAWTYRALKNGEILMGELGDWDLSARCKEAALKLKANYAKYLVNHKTGWVISWRSRDGQVHDYAHLWVNGPACAFGVLDKQTAQLALANLEKLRNKLGICSAGVSAPFSLLPLKKEDHMMPVLPFWNANKTEPTFEFFTDGSMGPSAVTYYLRALSIHGFKKEAKEMASALDKSFADSIFTGGAPGGFSMGEGNEFLSWEGLPCGYEGTFGPNFGVLYAIAVEQGIIKPKDPEWWPER